MKMEKGLLYDKSNFDISNLSLDYNKLYDELLNWREAYKEDIYDGFLHTEDKNSCNAPSFDKFSKSMLGG